MESKTSNSKLRSSLLWSKRTQEIFKPSTSSGAAKSKSNLNVSASAQGKNEPAQKGPRPGEAKPSEGRSRSESKASSHMENVDGADFQKHFQKLQVSNTESVSANGAASGGNGSARSSVYQNRNENSSPGSSSRKVGALEESRTRQKGHETEVRGQGVRQPETSLPTQSTKAAESATRNPISKRDVEVYAIEGAKGQSRHESIVPGPEGNSILQLNLEGLWEGHPNASFNITDALPPDKNPFQEVDPPQLGFVNYLYDKASTEIKDNKSDAAKPYLERLSLIKGTERVIGALNDEYYGPIIVDGVSRLQHNDDAAAFRVLEQLGETKYRNILEKEIVIHSCSSALQLIQNSSFKEAFEKITELKGHELDKHWTYSVESPVAKLTAIAGDYIKKDAISHIEAKDYTKAVELLQFLEESKDSGHIRTICSELARNFLKDALSDIGKLNPDLAWMNVFRADKIIDIGDWGPTRPGDGSLVKIVFEGITNKRDARKTAINYDYSLRNAVGPEKGIVEARSSILRRIRQYYELQITSELEKHNFQDAFQNLLELQQFWREPHKAHKDVISRLKMSNVTVTPTEYLRIVELFLVSRQRKFKIHWGDDKNKRDSKAEDEPSMSLLPTTPGLGFVYCLVHAEIFYFERRDLEKALFWCQQAVDIADSNIPTWVSKSDALYLLARIFQRKNMMIDADYYYSLIPSFEKYDQWRIYGNPGAVFRKTNNNSKMNRGSLGMSLDEFASLVEKIAQGMSADDRGAEEEISTLIRAVYADDFAWSGKEIRWSTRYTGLKLSGPLLHFLSSAGPLEYLQIAFHNPWINIREADDYGNTPLHKAAKVFDKEKAKFLIQNGASIAAPNAAGDSPLHLMLRFPGKLKMEGADISGTISLFVDVVTSTGKDSTQKVYLLATGNKLGQTPIDILRTCLVEELATLEARTQIGYLSRFVQAWDVISKSPHCPADYKKDPIFAMPAQRERDLRTGRGPLNIWGGKLPSNQPNLPPRPSQVPTPGTQEYTVAQSERDQERELNREEARRKRMRQFETARRKQLDLEKSKEKEREKREKEKEPGDAKRTKLWGIF
ncbi:hypothetical protein TWF481_003760 [Arthrobotrys musiformis]|uniref:Uncharacterized protein n=1 Tax=Arthrobotrys musiformis TaxID=47236 RepID=A0AAV9WIT1_9PEZI